MTTETAHAESPWELSPCSRAILFIDVAGSLRVTRQLGDARAYHLLKFLANAIRETRPSTRRVIRSLGDGFLLTFDCVDDALAHAATAQTEVALRNPTEVQLKIRCGIHYGGVIEAEGDVFGVAVYLANRVTSHAHGGEILLTGSARSMSEFPDHEFKELGPTLLPGFEEPVPLYEYVRQQVLARAPAI